MEASHTKHRPHLKVGKDMEDVTEDYGNIPDNCGTGFLAAG